MGQKQSNVQRVSEVEQAEHHSDNVKYFSSVDPLKECVNDLYVQYQVLSDEHLNLPFLKDKLTLDYIHISKVMFVMRGLPGSGRPIVVKRIQALFEDAVVCSTSEYFIQCGRYEFDPNKLEEAKIFCQEKARNACETSTHVVVIDNTNMRKWEMKYYFRLASETCYVVVLVEPWKLNIDQLVQRNHHTEDIEQLSLQLQQWETVIPLYFGWFLNEADSRMLKLVGLAHLEECLKVPEFAEDLKNLTHSSDVKDIYKYYAMPESCKGGMLHCTSKYCSFGEVPGSFEYATSKEVLEGCGQCYELCIVGFVMTPRTFGARVKLGKEELKLWDQEDCESPTSKGISSSTGYRPFPRNSTYQNPIVSVSTKDKPWFPHCQATLVCSEELKPSFQPTKGKGSRAHVTLGCAEDVTAVTTGYDLCEVIECEGNPEIVSKCRTFSLPRGWLRDYGKSRWVLYMCRQITVSTVFTGSY
ncbi:2',3'-cyclic-nucleotide 3'-phosphodiesterase-like [Periplaneta americana]|uniref:2',3'-cyclic-nucleotide 3'-phosphodiesterase-like n=1 Tax=Periplaneta americana TaxID=6978 RepID=UPI0037E896FB